MALQTQDDHRPLRGFEPCSMITPRLKASGVQEIAGPVSRKYGKGVETIAS